MLACSKKKTSNKKTAQFGEKFVISWLKSKKFKILALNWKSRNGEIDIIASKDEILTFVEVKTRTSWQIDPSLAVGFSKQSKILETANKYILENNILDKVIRFDVALVKPDLNNTKLNYIANAFTE